MTGAANPHAAVDSFLAAITAEDLQALGAIWGTANGPARDQMSMDQLQKRELTMMCSLSHDSYRILSEAPGLNGILVVAVELKYKNLSHVAQFQIGKASDGRYYVFGIPNFPEFDQFCARKHQG